MNSVGNIKIRESCADDLKNVRQLLRESDLPFEDVDEHFSDFPVAMDDGRLIGAVGIECYKPDGLLRSLAVDAESQGDGLGSKLLKAMEYKVMADGITALYLLTTTAETFFERNGFIKTERDGVPEAVRNTHEFKSICPVSAVCLKKRIA